ncbi:MAG: molybdopterin molybdotransferase MoeA [Actinobacteria bacterium]|nr:molybdopterin molybdotransferase MoeA [Actinomycetota bacterium]
MSVEAPRWAAARLLAHQATALESAQARPLSESVGRVLAKALVAPYALPRDATSAMDGWAVAGAGPWHVIGQVLAGSAPEVVLSPGQAVVIATGAVIPDGADTVVRSEDGTSSGGLLRAAVPEPGRHIRPAGEECAAGELLIPAGTVLTPVQVGLCAALGLDELLVRGRPVVRALVFGDEVRQHGTPGIGEVRDAIGPQLPSWVTSFGGRAGEVAYVPDTLEDHIGAIEQALTSARVVITSGGTAAGPRDHLHQAIEALGGRLVVDSVAVRPGHPMLLAEFHDRYLLGLPGNPQSAVVALLTLGDPLFRGMTGQELDGPTSATSGVALPAPATEDRLVAGNLIDGAFWPAAQLGSAMLRGLAESSGFAVLPPGGVATGEAVGWLSVG